MTWRPARSIQTFLDQMNRHYPGRNKASDGIIGDASHSSRSSDHNPNTHGVVCAIDITHDPKHADMHVIFDRLRQVRDNRMHYAIFDGHIVSSTTSPWQVRPYTPPPGGSMHREHLHLSVMQDPHLYDDPRSWPVFAVVHPVPSWYHRPLKVTNPELHGDDVSKVRAKLGMAAAGAYTSHVAEKVREFCKAHNLYVSGQVGEDVARAMGE